MRAPCWTCIACLCSRVFSKHHKVVKGDRYRMESVGVKLDHRLTRRKRRKLLLLRVTKRNSELGFGGLVMNIETTSEPSEYGPVHLGKRYLPAIDPTTLILGTLLIGGTTFLMSWTGIKGMYAIADDVKVIKSDVAKLPPMPTFNEKWANGIGDLLRQSQQMELTLRAVGKRVESVDYSVNGLENAVGSLELKLTHPPANSVALAAPAVLPVLPKARPVAKVVHTKPVVVKPPKISLTQPGQQ